NGAYLVQQSVLLFLDFSRLRY
ncbi:putative adhesin, partial [Vibrio parahaemolyticus V-223/04]